MIFFRVISRLIAAAAGKIKYMGTEEGFFKMSFALWHRPRLKKNCYVTYLPAAI